MWAREYQNSPFWFHIRFPHSLLSLSKKHISLCQLLTIEPSVAEFKSTGCDSCGPWSGVSQRAGQTFLPALWLTMGTITSATARHSDDERKRRSGGLFSESVNYLAAYMAHSAFPPSLLLSSSSPFSHFLFSLWLHRLTLRNIIWFEIQHFPLCHVVGSAAHALCRSLISIHSLLKCSSIHLRRMLRLALKVERILLNEYRQRNATCSIERDFKLFLTFYCFDWVIANTLTHILFPHFRSHIKPKHFSFALTFFEMSHPSYQSRMHYTDTHLTTLLGTESP